MDKATKRVLVAQAQASKNIGSAKHNEAMEKRLGARAKAETKYQEAVNASAEAVGSGTGKVGLLLPSNYVTTYTK